MKSGPKFLLLLSLLILGGLALIGSAYALEEIKHGNTIIRRNSDSTTGGRRWRIVTFSENIPCETTSQAIEVGDYGYIRPFAFKLSDQANCIISLEVSPDGSNWAYSPQYISFEQGYNAYYGGYQQKEIEGPYYRVRTYHNQSTGGEAKGNFKVMAYIYSD